MKIIHTQSEINKHNKNLCITPYCMKRPKLKCWKCSSCRKKIQQRNNPLKYAWHVLRNNAKRRGKKFTLTFKRFKELSEENDYLNKKGTKSKSLQIDRYKEEEGYTDDNVRCITLRENVHKYNRHKQSLAQEAGF